MSPDGRDLDGLIGERMFGRERGRFTRIHEALLEAGPPPELPASLSRAPQVAISWVAVTRGTRLAGRRLLAAAAAALAVAAAGSALLLTRGSVEGPPRTVAMHGTGVVPTAQATLRIGARDAAGNWLLTLRVRGLPPVPAGSYYEMYLTSRGRIVVGCGTFKTDPGTTVVRFDVPFRLDEYSGWVIRREQPHGRPGPTLLTT